MSRHRNVKNLIAEDDYYDYGDDYYDDYDDYGDYGYSQAMKPKHASQQKQQQQKKNQTQHAQKKQSNSSASTKTASTTKTNTTAAVSVPATTTTGSKNNTPGVVAPPAGWGKPSSSSSNENKSSNNNITTSSSSTKKVPQILLQQIGNDSTEQQLSMVVIGHVDAGKSTMMGQLLYQVGKVTKRQATKITGTQDNNDDNNNIQWAWLLDEDQGERTRGVTMQIATKAISTPKHPRVVLLDAPGHADFVPTMITGAADADAALLVVDASADSAFEAPFNKGGQTKEHILLARGLGVSQIIVCINKLDVRNWSQQVYLNIQQKLLPFLTGHANFKEKRIQFVPTSGLTGDNVKNNQNLPTLLKKWYNGPTLFQAIDNFQPVKQTTLDKPLRIILSDVYAEGKAVAARGRVAQGFLETGEKIVVLPIADEATITNINHLHALDNANLHKYAVVGQTVDLTLTGIDPVRVPSGSILTRTNLNARPPIATRLQAKLAVMDELVIPIIRGAQVLFHIQSLDIPATVSKLISSTKRSNNQTKNRPRAITAASSAVVEITLSNPICMESFSDCRALGRFVLRRSGNTIAVGMIEQVF